MRKVFTKLQIFILQTTDFHFANYRFSFRFVPFRYFANYSKPFFIRIVSKWNDLPRDIVEAESVHHFKNKLHHYLLNKF